jgi:hypothetical protein
MRKVLLADVPSFGLRPLVGRALLHQRLLRSQIRNRLLRAMSDDQAQPTSASVLLTSHAWASPSMPPW